MVFDDIRIALLEQNSQAPGQADLVERYKSLLKREIADRLPEGVSPDTVVISLPTEQEKITSMEGSSPFDEQDFSEEQGAEAEEGNDAESESSGVVDDSEPMIDEPDIDIAGQDELLDEESVEETPESDSEGEDAEPPPGTTPRGAGTSKKRGGKFRRWRRN